MPLCSKSSPSRADSGRRLWDLRLGMFRGPAHCLSQGLVMQVIDYVRRRRWHRTRVFSGIPLRDSPPSRPPISPTFSPSAIPSAFLLSQAFIEAPAKATSVKPVSSHPPPYPPPRTHPYPADRLPLRIVCALSGLQPSYSFMLSMQWQQERRQRLLPTSVPVFVPVAWQYAVLPDRASMSQSQNQ